MENGETGFDAGKKVKGRKRHIIVDTLGFVLRAEVHSAGVQDRDGAARVFKKLISYFPFKKRICGDGGHAGPIAHRLKRLVRSDPIMRRLRQ